MAAAAAATAFYPVPIDLVAYVSLEDFYRAVIAQGLLSGTVYMFAGLSPSQKLHVVRRVCADELFVHAPYGAALSPSTRSAIVEVVRRELDHKLAVMEMCLAVAGDNVEAIKGVMTNLNEFMNARVTDDVHRQYYHKLDYVNTNPFDVPISDYNTHSTYFHMHQFDIGHKVIMAYNVDGGRFKMEADALVAAVRGMREAGREGEAQALIGSLVAGFTGVVNMARPDLE